MAATNAEVISVTDAPVEAVVTPVPESTPATGTNKVRSMPGIKLDSNTYRRSMLITSLSPLAWLT